MFMKLKCPFPLAISLHVYNNNVIHYNNNHIPLKLFHFMAVNLEDFSTYLALVIYSN